MADQKQLQDKIFSKITDMYGFGDLFELHELLKQWLQVESISNIISALLDHIETIGEPPFLVNLLQHAFDEGSNISLVNKEKVYQYTSTIYPIYLRIAAIKSMASHYSERNLDTLLEIVKDYKGINSIRIEAIDALSLYVEPDKSSYRNSRIARTFLDNAYEQTNDLLLRKNSIQKASFIPISLEELPILKQLIFCSEPSISYYALKLLQDNGDLLSYSDGKKLFEQLIFTNNDIHFRGDLIRFLGYWGEVDLVERVLSLSFRDEVFLSAISDMISNIMKKPINLLYVRPDIFEYMIKDLLTKMEYSNVSVTQHSHDEGIDIIAYRDGFGATKGTREKVVVQCKRYSQKKIDRVTLEKFSQDIQFHGALQGLFITTSEFASDKADLERKFPTIKLLDRQDLITKIADYFCEQIYTISYRE